MTKNIFFTIVLFLSVTLVVNAQWNKGKGNGYYKLSVWSLVADQHYTDSGELNPLTTRGVFTTSFYGEYGLTDKIDLIAYVPFYTRSFQNNTVSGTRGNTISEGAELNSFGDTDIGIRYGLLKKDNLAISTSLKFGLPLAKTGGGNSSAVLQNGDGEFNQHLQVDIGVPFKMNNIPAYGKTFIAYNNRTKGFSDEVYYGGEVGLQFFKKLWLIGRLNVLKSTKNGSAPDAGNGSVFANNIEYTNINFEAAYYLTKKIGISYNYGTAISGRIIAAAPTHSGGIFLDIK